MEIDLGLAGRDEEKWLRTEMTGGWGWLGR